MTERNEQTSPDIASFAARVMRMPDEEIVRQAYHKPELFRSMAASLLTQAPDIASQPEAVLQAVADNTEATARALDSWSADVAEPFRKPRARKPKA